MGAAWPWWLVVTTTMSAQAHPHGALPAAHRSASRVSARRRLHRGDHAELLHH